MYPDRLLVSPAPAGGNTNWFDPFFQVKMKNIFCVTMIPIPMTIRRRFKNWKIYLCYDDPNIDDNQACEELGCQIDYLATHDYEGKANKVMNRLEMLYNRRGQDLACYDKICQDSTKK